MPYATTSDLGYRYSPDMLNRLAFDDDVERLHDEYKTSMIVISALEEASGRVDAALSVSRMYMPEDLHRLTANSRAFLVRIVCDIAVNYLHRRRDGCVPESLVKQMEETESLLDRIRGGERLFILEDDTSRNTAGLPELIAPSTVELERINSIAARGEGFFPYQATRQNYNHNYD